MKMMKVHWTTMIRISLTILLMVSVSTSVAQRVKTVEAEYTYHAPENITMEQARRTALERAKIQAIADEFGTIVSQYNATRIENTEGKTMIDFTSIGDSQVKGEWIETIGSPQYSIFYEDNMLVVKATVKGKVREIISAQIDLKSKILRNGTEDRFEDDRFRSGDDLYLSFKSPIKGYLAVYLMDADKEAFCLLPYQKQQTGIYPIEANREYLFFSERNAPAEERSFVDEYTMTCSRSIEHNQIYVIFSPHSFAKAVDSDTNKGLPRQLSNDDFNKWLVKCRKQDKDMIVRLIPIEIEK